MNLPPELHEIVADLNAKIEDKEYSTNDRDVFTAIRDCITNSQPIGPELQEQYVRILANDQRQDRYGK